MESQYGTVLSGRIKRDSWVSQEGYGTFMINGVNSLFVEGDFPLDGDITDHDSLIFELDVAEGWQHIPFSFAGLFKELPFVVSSHTTRRVEKTGYSDRVYGYCSHQSNTLSKSVLTASDYVYDYPLEDTEVDLIKGDAVYMSGYSEFARGGHLYWDNVFFVNETRTYTSRDDIYNSRALSSPIDYDAEAFALQFSTNTLKAEFQSSFMASYKRGINPITPNPLELKFSNVSDRDAQSLIAWCESFCAYKAKPVYIEEISHIKEFFLDTFSVEFKDFNINVVTIKLLPDFRSTI